VQPGEKVPLDGIVVEGSSSLNTSALTGESLPRDVRQGEEVISGCINMTGVLKVRTTKQFEESTVSKILELVENSGSRK
ncbi:P-type ATPase, partial [Veillonella parvula]|nr:heavy metal translocating P-type ATPase [Veillonella parvula]